MTRAERLIVWMLIVAIVILIALVLWVGGANAKILCPDTPTPPTATNTPLPTNTPIPTDTPIPTEWGIFPSEPPLTPTTFPPPLPPPPVRTPTATATEMDRPRHTPVPVLFPVTGEGRPDGGNGLFIAAVGLVVLGLALVWIAKRMEQNDTG